MQITINTDVLYEEHLSLGEFLIMLMGFHEINYEESLHSLLSKGIVQPNVFHKMSVVLSNNTKNLVARILTKSNGKVAHSSINFTALAQKLQALYPSGIKPGTTYPWQGSTEEVAQKLRSLVAVCNFSFSEEEAVKAAQEYVGSFSDDTQHMQLLKYFILKTGDGNKQDNINSLFMTIIENNR